MPFASKKPKKKEVKEEKKEETPKLNLKSECEKLRSQGYTIREVAEVLRIEGKATLTRSDVERILGS